MITVEPKEFEILAKWKKEIQQLYVQRQISRAVVAEHLRCKQHFSFAGVVDGGTVTVSNESQALRNKIKCREPGHWFSAF